MTTTPQYDSIYAAIDDKTVRDVFHALKNHVGKANAITIDALTLVVYGESAKIKLGTGYSVNPSKIRAVRDAIEIMRNQPYDIPVCSNSGKAGRYLPANMDEVFECSAEYISRGTKDIATGRNMERVAKAWFARSEPMPVHVTQDTLFEMPKRVEYA